MEFSSMYGLVLCPCTYSSMDEPTSMYELLGLAVYNLSIIISEIGPQEMKNNSSVLSLYDSNNSFMKYSAFSSQKFIQSFGKGVILATVNGKFSRLAL
jgi:hypothetical protein